MSNLSWRKNGKRNRREIKSTEKREGGEMNIQKISFHFFNSIVKSDKAKTTDAKNLLSLIPPCFYIPEEDLIYFTARDLNSAIEVIKEHYVSQGEINKSFFKSWEIF